MKNIAVCVPNIYENLNINYIFYKIHLNFIDINKRVSLSVTTSINY